MAKRRGTTPNEWRSLEDVEKSLRRANHPRLAKLLHQMRHDRFLLLSTACEIYAQMGPGGDRMEQAKDELEYQMLWAAQVANNSPPFTIAHQAQAINVTLAKLQGLRRKHGFQGPPPRKSYPE